MPDLSEPRALASGQRGRLYLCKGCGGIASWRVTVDGEASYWCFDGDCLATTTTINADLDGLNIALITGLTDAYVLGA